MVLGGLQAGMSIKGGIDAQKAAGAAGELNTLNYQSTARGISSEGADRSRAATSESSALEALGASKGGAAGSSGNIALDVSMQMQGAHSEYLNNKSQIDSAKKQSRLDALSGVLSGATLMTQGMMGGPKVGGMTSYDPRWGGLGRYMGWFKR